MEVAEVAQMIISAGVDIFLAPHQLISDNMIQKDKQKHYSKKYF